MTAGVAVGPVRPAEAGAARGTATEVARESPAELGPGRGRLAVSRTNTAAASRQPRAVARPPLGGFRRNGVDYDIFALFITGES